ncbi:MAG: hypothetical protein KIB40_12525 [Pantoea sp.]|uniref:Uncharacterized protein n=1 Tax=Pantoea brenneri TaxID=472694 RepID=A0AAX3JC90_9GAMM|nr:MULTISPECIES: hypothetical protein [Pantoea]MBS6033949.1 hypothetical protein [Pantoea sp.]VXC60006.1 conserved hypothetical protein [Pantoea brenneri]
MAQVIKFTGLEEGGLFSRSMLEDYNKLKTNPAKRAFVINVIRSGYAVDQMGLAPIIALMEETYGDTFMTMTKRERLQRLLSLISVTLGETTPPTPGMQPVQAPVAESAAAAVAAPPAENAQPAQAESRSSEAAQPAQADSQPEPVSEAVSVTHNDEDNSSRRVEEAPKGVAPSALKLPRHRVSG